MLYAPQSIAENAPAAERRFLVRYPAKSDAQVLRDSDMMRVGSDARLVNISIGGLGLESHVPLLVNEQIKVSLCNAIQRITKEVRGVVRHVTPDPSGRLRIGVELYGRLTPLEVSLFRMGLGTDRDKRVWM